MARSAAARPSVEPATPRRGLTAPGVELHRTGRRRLARVDSSASTHVDEIFLAGLVGEQADRSL